jgi:hypothetical protein
MSWLYSQALVEEFSEANSWDGEQFVQSNGNPTPQAYCAPDKMTDFSRLSRFGMTCKPLTENLGGALLTWYLEDFRAKTSAQQEKEQESTESVQECGEKWRGSFVKYDPDTLSWRTHQCSLLGDLEPFSETWPQWGLMRDGECWEQQTLEQTIRGTESGLSPNGVDTFHTPNCTGLDGGSNSRKALKKRTEMWPTPCLPGNGGTNGKAKLKEMLKYPTPTAHDAKDTGTAPSEGRRNTPCLAYQAGGKLNPMWVEWLMGWPLGWTDLKPLETGKCHSVQQQLGES